MKNMLSKVIEWFVGDNENDYYEDDTESFFEEEDFDITHEDVMDCLYWLVHTNEKMAS